MRIGINCGHTVSGTLGCGAVGYIDESVETRRIGIKLERMLIERGHTVYDCTNDYAPSVSSNLSQIVSIANKQPLDLFVSIHFNSGGGKGTEVFTYGGKQHIEAVNVCNALNELGFKNRGVKDGSNLYVVRRSNAKAMLIEVCFVDTDDAELYKKIGAERIAQAICGAITGQEIEEDIDMEELKQLQNEITELKKQTATYDYMDGNMPEWAKPTIQKLMDKGVLVGDEEGRLGLTMDMIKVFVINDRAGLYGMRNYTSSITPQTN